VHETGVYSVGVGSKGPALERFPNIKKKKKNLLSTTKWNISNFSINSKFHQLRICVDISNNNIVHDGI
jgi:hypothetical protein